MPTQGWISLLSAELPVAGAVYTVSTTPATLSPALGNGADSAQVNPPGQYLGWRANMFLRITARGYITTTTTAGTLAFSLAARVGNTGSTYIALTGAHATLNSYATAATTGIPWKLEGGLRCTAIASAGNTAASQAEMYISPLPATAQTMAAASAGVNLYMPSASGETASAIDTTQVQGISLRCVGSAASGSIQCTQWLVEMMN
jgi:hypothetical protein